MTMRVTEERNDAGVTFRVETDHGERELWLEWGGDIVPSPGSSLMAAGAVGLVHAALAADDDEIHFDGPLSTDLLESLQEYADAWSFLGPDVYSPVRLSAASLIDEVRPLPDERRAPVIAFSGGVDSLHATVTEQDRATAADPPLLVLVHGLDVGLDAVEGWERSLDNARRSAESFDVPLSWVRTNLRRDFHRFWRYEFMAGAVAALQLWRHDARYAVAGSDESGGYDVMIHPAGSNPVTNPLLGSTYFPLKTLGLDLTRTQKCEVIAARPELIAQLRVCWREGDTGRNCGRCVKCVRTRYSLAAVGVQDPPTLRHVTRRDLRRLHVRDRSEVELVKRTLDHEPSHLTETERRDLTRWARKERIMVRLRGRGRWMPQPVRSVLKSVVRI